MLQALEAPKLLGLFIACCLATGGSATAAPYDNLVVTPARGESFFGAAERFNRYYTDPRYQSDRVLHVSPSGNGDGSISSPMSPDQAFSQVKAGEEILFLDGQYAGCWELDRGNSGSYDKPIVIRAASDKVSVDCCGSGRKTCFNLEGANHVAIDGFTLNGGSYGVRAVGMEYAASGHQKGIAVLNNRVGNQHKDPIFSGQSDWMVVDGNTAFGAGRGDGHGIYLSNGGDWLIVRGNELYGNSSSDFQINADPISTCAEDNIPYDDPRCDGSALDGQGQGISEFVLVEGNYFHNSDVGPNFTSVRNSVIRNNVFGPYVRHGTSFWQETGNPRLGSSDNRIEHNLFIGSNRRHVLQSIRYSDRNTVRNNILLGYEQAGDSITANPDTVLVEIDPDTVRENLFSGNIYIGGRFSGFSPATGELRLKAFDPAWFSSFPADGMGTATGFRPGKTAPFVDAARLLPTTPMDMEGRPRRNPVNPGPWEYSGKLQATVIQKKASGITGNRR